MVDNSNMPHPKCLGSQKNPGTEPKTCEKGPKLGFEYLPTSKTSHCVRTACMAFPLQGRVVKYNKFVLPSPLIVFVARLPEPTLICPLESPRDSVKRGEVELFHPLAGHVEPLVVGAHVVNDHGCLIAVMLVGHLRMVQGGPTNGPHLLGVN